MTWHNELLELSVGSLDRGNVSGVVMFTLPSSLARGYYTMLIASATYPVRAV